MLDRINDYLVARRMLIASSMGHPRCQGCNNPITIIDHSRVWVRGADDLDELCYRHQLRCSCTRRVNVDVLSTIIDEAGYRLATDLRAIAIASVVEASNFWYYEGAAGELGLASLVEDPSTPDQLLKYNKASKRVFVGESNDKQQ